LLNQIRKERDADFVIARSAVVLEAPELNITPAMHNLMNDGSNSDASNVSASGAMLQVSDAKIMTIDRYMLIPQSKVGRSVSSQVDGYTRAAHTEFGGEQNALLARRSELVREQAAQPSGAVTEKIKQFEQDRDVYEQKIHVREKQLQQGAERARGQIERALEPILRRIMAAHGANILLDQAVVPKASAEFDLTAEAIIMLDAELPTVPVSLPPAEQ
jgi:Skp family chaperone for outer membrane proteins